MVFLGVVGLFSLVVLGGCDINGIENGELDFFTLTMEIEGTPESQGEVTGEISPDKGSHEMEKNTFVDLQAWRTSFAWDFTKWSGDVKEEDEAETTIYMNTDKTVTAVFDEVRNRDVYTQNFIMDTEGNMSDNNLEWTGITLEHEYFYKPRFGK